jgi:hypothetical protein
LGPCERGHEQSSRVVTDEKSFDPPMGCYIFKQNSALWSKSVEKQELRARAELIRNTALKTILTWFRIHSSKYVLVGSESTDPNYSYLI